MGHGKSLLVCYRVVWRVLRGHGKVLVILYTVIMWTLNTNSLIW